jgi:hypothetical protein
VGVLAAAKVFRDVSKDRVLAATIILAGLGLFFIGTAMQTVMPTIASTTTGISSSTAYGVLLFANGLGGLLLEGTGWIRLSVRAALWSTVVYGASTVFFAVSNDYLVAAPLLVTSGLANLAALSITQTVAQLRAPAREEGPGDRRLQHRRQRDADRQRVHRRPGRRGDRAAPRTGPVLSRAMRLRARARRLPGGRRPAFPSSPPASPPAGPA